MAKQPKTEGAKSFADIAATLLVQQPSTVPADGKSAQTDPNASAVVEDDQLTEGDTGEDTELPTSEGEGANEGGETEELTTAAEGDDGAESTEGDEGVEGDGVEYLDIEDDVLVPVTIDGEEREVTLGELKQALSGEGAIEKRLQEATETRKEAVAASTQVLEVLAANETMLSQALSSLDDSVFAGVIPQPDANTRASNPELYLRHLDAYNEDQARIKAAKDTVQKMVNDLSEQRKARLEQYAKVSWPMIVKEIPELGDKAKQQKMFNDLTLTAKAYGYTDEEISSALDPRMFMLVRDAMRYRAMTDPKRERTNVTDLNGQPQKRIRRLRGGGTSAKTVAKQRDQNRAKAVEQAKKTGKAADVARTLIM